MIALPDQACFRLGLECWPRYTELVKTLVAVDTGIYLMSC